MLEYTPDRHLTGGLRLPANKADATSQPIARGLLPKQLVVSLAQHRGPEARPVVEAGGRVQRGEVIGIAQGPVGADVHAASSGIVRAIEQRRVPALTGVETATCIVIDADGADGLGFAAEQWPADRAQQLRRLTAAGIVGLGGAVYPTAAKIGAVQACRVLVINGAECEPYISCDDMLMREAPDQIVAGARLLARILGAEQCIIAIERDKPLAIDAIGHAAEAVAAEGPPLRLAELPSIYPAGGERQLIEVLTGEEVPAGRYPSDIGFACQNVGTAYAVHRLASHGEPLLTRIVTVAGSGVAGARNVEVPIGTPIAEVVDFCGGYRGDVRRLIHGGSMMGYALPSDDIAIGKGSNCIIAATAEEIREEYSEWPCIRCGECQSACPARLQPQDLLIAARAADHASLDALGLEECIECGCCDVVCPSHIPLTEIFRRTKGAHRLHAQQVKFSEESEQRYLRREERQRERAERERQLQLELKHEVESGAVAKSAIQAAVDRARRKRERGSEPD